MEIAHVNSLRNVGPLRSRQHWILFTCAKVLDLCWVLDQHCTCSLREQSWHRQIKKTLYRLFPAKTCLSALGLHCTSNFPAQCCLRHFWATLTWQDSYAMLSQHGRHNIVQVIFIIKVICLPWANIEQVIFLCNVDPERSGHHCKLFSSAKLFVDCAMIGGWNDRIYWRWAKKSFFEFSRIFFVWKQRFRVCLLLILHK